MRLFSAQNMPSQVTPTESCVHRDRDEMPSTVSVQPTMNEVSIVEDSIPHQGHVNEQLLEAIDEVYSPVLKLMKLFGTYFGDTSLKRWARTDSRCRKHIDIPRMYCGVVVSGLWLNFVMGFSSIFSGGDIYIFIMFSVWCLLVAVNGTIFLIVLPLTATRKSRFENFLSSLLANKNDVNLKKVKSKSRKYIVVFCLFFISAAIGATVTSLILNMNLAAFKPWNEWSGIRIISLIFLILGCGVWLISIVFFCITCLILEELFDDLRKRMASLHSISVDLAALKMEHHGLCEGVELADKMFSSFLMGVVSLYIPLLCFNFYLAVSSPKEEAFLVFLLNVLFWTLASACMLTVIMLFGCKVSEKVWQGKHNYFQI